MYDEQLSYTYHPKMFPNIYSGHGYAEPWNVLISF